MLLALGVAPYIFYYKKLAKENLKNILIIYTNLSLTLVELDLLLVNNYLE